MDRLRPHPPALAGRLLLTMALALGFLGSSALSASSAAATPAALTRAALPPMAPTHETLPVCRAPLPGSAGCLAYELTPSPGSSAAAQLSPRARARTRARERAAHPASLPGTHAASPQAQLEAAAESAQEPQPVTPADLHSAYDLPDLSPAESPQQTIALVDAYNDPNAEADLKIYDETFGLPACTTASGCFKQVNQSGETGNPPFPSSEAALEGEEAICKRSRQHESRTEREERETACSEVEEAASWGVEISTDIEVAHSICQNCRIRLVEAASAEYADLEAAERTAARPTTEGGEAATEISNSWGGEAPPSDSAAFKHPGIVVTAAAGDLGYLNWTEAEASSGSYYSGADYPASSPHVVAVGGTKLTLTTGGSRQDETVWNEDPDAEGKNSGASGGGCSTSFKAPPWQSAVPDWSSVECGGGAEAKRAVADVAADGDPYSGVLVYDSSESKEYLLEIGGTSVASPIIAAAFALAGGAHDVEYPAETLYSHLGSASLYDVTEGGNGQCDGLYTAGCSGSMDPLSPLDCGAGVLICNAATGYDGPTGVGTPDGTSAFRPVSEEGKQTIEERQHAEEKLRAEERLREEAREAREREAREREERLTREKLVEEEMQKQSAGQASTSGSSGATNQSTTDASGTSGDKAPAGESSGIAPSTMSSGTGATAVRLSNLALTANALAAFHRAGPAISRVAFAFTLSAAAEVHATLTRQARIDGHLRWVSEPDALTVLAHRGRNRFHLHGRAALATGRYRLTLTPAHGQGQGRSLTFVLR